MSEQGLSFLMFAAGIYLVTCATWQRDFVLYRLKAQRVAGVIGEAPAHVFYQVMGGIFVIVSLLRFAGVIQKEPAAEVASPIAAAAPAVEPVAASLVDPWPDPRPAPVPAASQQRAVQGEATAESETPRLSQVWSDSATRTFYPDNCSNHPVNATRVAKSVASMQGYTSMPCPR